MRNEPLVGRSSSVAIIVFVCLFVSNLPSLVSCCRSRTNCNPTVAGAEPTAQTFSRHGDETTQDESNDACRRINNRFLSSTGQVGVGWVVRAEGLSHQCTVTRL